ncbi:hypothetical protein HYW54_00230 [Candidatus Gottesmanbacteria bacterium]|nr:hypothetical protein [Candidatus Gottesmanbacteria bacterium]
MEAYSYTPSDYVEKVVAEYEAALKRPPPERAPVPEPVSHAPSDPNVLYSSTVPAVNSRDEPLHQVQTQP